MASVSTHVLDAGGGGARSGVRVELRDAEGAVVGKGETGTDGRIGSLGSELATGVYRLSWRTGGSFVQEVAVTVALLDDRHYHVPLLASEASAVTYLGV